MRSDETAELLQVGAELASREDVDEVAEHLDVSPMVIQHRSSRSLVAGTWASELGDPLRRDPEQPSDIADCQPAIQQRGHVVGYLGGGAFSVTARLFGSFAGTSYLGEQGRAPLGELRTYVYGEGWLDCPQGCFM